MKPSWIARRQVPVKPLKTASTCKDLPSAARNRASQYQWLKWDDFFLAHKELCSVVQGWDNRSSDTQRLSVFSSAILGKLFQYQWLGYHKVVIGAVAIAFVFWEGGGWGVGKEEKKSRRTLLHNFPEAPTKDFCSSATHAYL